MSEKLFLGLQTTQKDAESQTHGCALQVVGFIHGEAGDRIKLRVCRSEEADTCANPGSEMERVVGQQPVEPLQFQRLGEIAFFDAQDGELADQQILHVLSVLR